MSKLKLVLLWTIFAVQCPSLFSQAPAVHVGHDFWGFKEGAPEEIYALAQTDDGFLWLGTETGLVRFDGQRFEPFRSPFGDQLLSTAVYALFTPPSGGLWIGYRFGGFSFVDHGRVTNYETQLGSPTGNVWGFAQDRDGILWAATNTGLWRFSRGLWEHIGAEWNAPKENVLCIGFDSEGILWALSGPTFGPLDLVYLMPGTTEFRVASGNLVVEGFTLSPDGKVVTELPPNSLKGNQSDGRPSAYPVLRKKSFQIVDKNNAVWMLHQDHLLMRVSAKEQLSDAIKKASPSNSETFEIDPYFEAKLVDRERNIWFGTATGLHRFFYSPLTKQELPLGTFALARGDDGTIWIATVSRSYLYLYRVVDGRAETFLKLKSEFLNYVYRAPDKALWLGGQGIWRLAGRNLVRIVLPPELAKLTSFLQAITQDQHGGMWISFRSRGLYRLADGVWTPYGGRTDIPKTTTLLTEFTDSLGRVWFGYDKNQLAVLDGDWVRVFGRDDGVKVGNITAIYGRGAEIWIGGEFGLQHVDSGRIRSVSALNRELLSGISGIIETADGDLWLNGLSGIVHLPRSEIAEALNNPVYQVKGEHFGRREGLPGFAFQLRPLNTAVEGTDGKLWFATRGGVEWLSKSQSENKVPAPPITIQSVSADGRNYQLGSALRFPAHTSSVQISYAAVSLSDPEAIHFRYKLRETDRDWHEVGTASPVSYRNLPPGSYYFNVNATDTNGVWSDAVATAEFSILPAFYQTGWFIALCALSAMALLYMLYLLRVRQVARQFDVRLEERVGERTRIARELHDTLLQSFQGILLLFQAVSNELQPGKTRQKLESAIDQAAAAITEGRDAVQGLRTSTVERNDLADAMKTLGEGLAAGQTNPNPVDFCVAVEGTSRNLHPIVRDETYRIVGEGLRNAFRHANAKRIEVKILYDERRLRVLVRDDGKGIDPKLLSNDGREGHYGFRGMRERAKLIDAQLRVWSAPDSGTEVELSIPAGRAYATSTERLRSWFAKKGSRRHS